MKETRHNSKPSQNAPNAFEQISEEMKKAAPKTKGEKFYDRFVAGSLFTMVYAASVAGAVFMKKSPWGNRNLFNPLRNSLNKNVSARLASSHEGAVAKMFEGGYETLGASATALLKEGEALAKEYHELTTLTGEALKKAATRISHIEKRAKFFSEHENRLKTIANGMDAEKGLSKAAYEELKPLLDKSLFVEQRMDKQAESVAEIMSLSLGGSIPAIPFKFLEDKRPDIIQNRDNKKGTGINDPLLEAAAQQRIVEEPSQSWGSAIGSRVATLGVIYATAFSPKLGDFIIGLQKSGGKALMTTKFGDKFMKGIDKLNVKWFPYKTENVNKEIVKKSRENKEFVGEMVVSDGTWTVYSTALMLGFAKLLAPIMGGRSKAEERHASTAPRPPAPHQKRTVAQPAHQPAPQREHSQEQQLSERPGSRVHHAAHEEALSAPELETGLHA